MKTSLILFLLLFTKIAFAQINDSQLLLLKKMIEINSATENTEGLKDLGNLISQEFSIRNLIVTKIDVSPAHSNAHSVYQIRRPTSDNKITLIGHIDTVFAATSSFKTIRIEGSQIFGPGVIDMKGGILLMRELVLGLPETALDHIQIVLNDDEEIGSIYSKNTVRKLLSPNSSVLILEPGLPDGSVVTSQSGVAWYELSVTGKAAHAGLEPEKGFNACTELAHKITKTVELTDLSFNLNVNPGIITGGTKPNIVCEQASTKIDVRFREMVQLEKVEIQLNSITNNIYSHLLPPGFIPTMNLKKLAFLPPLNTDKTIFLFSLLKQLEATFEFEINNAHVGYGSDGNNLSDLPLNILVGLGPFGGGMHTENEFMDIHSFSQRYRLNLNLINKLLQMN